MKGGSGKQREPNKVVVPLSFLGCVLEYSSKDTTEYVYGPIYEKFQATNTK